MRTFNKALFRASLLIHENINGYRLNLQCAAMPFRRWQEVTTAARRLELATQHGWLLSADRSKQNLLQQVDDLQGALAHMANELRQQTISTPIASQSELYRDLAALEEEFDGVDIHQDEQTLSIITDPILLEGVDLGRFQIRLNWRQSAANQPYSVVALDPNPAASNSSVTHPHVSDESLCEGDGRHAIHRALAEGRLYDFFTIVDRLLNTYSEGRAYVELSQWHGNPCHDCGAIVSEDDYSTCRRCDEMVCSDCATICSSCDEPFCSGCINACRQCDAMTCIVCLDRCRLCGSLICPNCIHHNLCCLCKEQHEPDEESAELGESPSAAPDAANDSDRLGETAVSA